MKRKRKNSSSKLSVFLYALIAFLGLASIVAGLGIKVYETRVEKANLLEAGEEPARHKLRTNNGDGTYKISLDVTGESEIKVNKVNVVVVFDRSGSMNYPAVNMSPTGRYGISNNGFITLYSNSSCTNAINNNTTEGPVYSGSRNNCNLYNEARYSSNSQSTPVRMTDAKSAVNNLAQTLLANNGKTVNGQTLPNDLVEMTLISFSTTTNTRNKTTSYSTFSGYVNDLTSNGGTNWEAALTDAKNFSFGDDNPTYVIFVSDGNPTFRLTRGGGTNGEDAQYGNYNPAVYGSGNSDNNGKNYSYARTQAKAIVDSGMKFYAIGAYGNVDKMQNLVNYAYTGDDDTAPTGGTYYYNASSTDELDAALNAILNEIQKEGIGDVSIIDGTTQNVELSSGTFNLLEVDESSFKYYTKAEGETEWTEWTITDDAMKAKLVNGEVKWDISNLGVLENGTTYKVEFDVYPSQYTNDLIADLKNGEVQYSQLESSTGEYAGLSKYIIEEDGEYYLETNTTAKLKYKDTRVGDEELEVGYDNPDPVVTEPDQIRMHKQWENDYDARRVDSVDLEVLRDGSNFYDVSLKESSGWSAGPVNIASGLMRVYYNGSTITGIEVLNAGHDYTFNELGEESYNWEMVAQTIHPMVINGTLKELILIDDAVTTSYTTDTNPLAQYSIPEAMKNDSSLKFYQANGYNYYRIDNTDKVYVEVNATQPTIEAYNYRRSNLNVQKLVDGDSANPEDEFEFTINVQDSGLSNGEDLWFSVYRSGTGCLELDDQLDTNVWIKKVDTEDASCRYYYHAAKNSSGNFPQLVVKMRAKDNLRFTNLTTAATFDVVESDPRANNYEYKMGEFKAWYGKDNDEIPSEYKDVEILDANREVKGNISLTNTSFYVYMTNTYELVDVDVEKEFDDDNNRDGIRPEEITVTLKANGGTAYDVDGEEIGPVTISIDADGKGSYSFEGLPRFDSTGKEIEYTVEEAEIDIPEGKTGYTVEYVDMRETKEETDSETGETTTTIVTVGKFIWKINNKHESETIDIDVTKVWSDGENQDGIRPTSVQVQLMKGEDDFGDPVTLNNDNEWKHTWEDLYKYEDGEEIEYTVEEIETDVITGTNGPGTYDYEVEGSIEEGFTVTNTHTPEVVTVTVEKAWDDKADQDGIRPDSVQIQLLKDGEAEGRPVTLTESENAEENWTYTWTNLAKYDDGDPITYTIEEVETSVITGTNGPGTYSYKITGDATDGFVVTNTHTPEVTTVSVEKVWEDNENQDGKRPESVEIQLMKNGEAERDPITLSDEAGWTYTWTNLDKYAGGEPAVYTVEETETDVITGEDGPGTYAYEITGTAASGFTVTNTHTPEKVNIKVTKVWEDNNDQDGFRPDEVQVYLITDDVDGTPVTLNDDNDWSHTWEDLPKYVDGEKIKYEVEEVTDEEVITGTNGPGTYSYEVTGSVEEGFTVTNTHTPETISVSVEKAWDDKADQDRIRPDSVQIQLLKDGSNYDSAITLSDEKGWTYTWTDLAKYDGGELVGYTVTEIKTSVITGENTATTYKFEVTGEQATGYIVTNTHTPEVVSVNVKKVWDDADNQDGIRPTNVKVQLKKNGEDEGAPQTLSDDNNWTYTWENLDKRLAGELVEYTVEEITTSVITEDSDGVGTYKLKITGDQEKGYVVTNTHTPEVKDIEGTKTWDDADNQDGKRPESITVNLLANGKVVDTVEVTEDDDWAYIFKGVPVYEKGVEITYSITEDEIDGYSTVITGFNIKNSYTPEITSVNGVKTWDDAGNQDGKRPDSIKVQLKADGEVVDTITVTADDDWAYSFTGLPKYNDGTEIEYSVDEETVPEGYTKEVKDYNITNSYVPKTIDIEGTKTWNDADDQDGKRPTSITVILKANGEEYRRTTVGASNGWSYSFTNVPAYSDGELITYTVDEETVPEGYSKSISGYNITNTHTPEITSVSGEKIWDDADDQDGKRPESITVKLLADGKQADSVTITEEDDWAYSFTNLPKYSKGKEISYTIDEVDVPDYDTTYDGFNITNKYVPETIDISVNKVWDDDNDRDKVRPTSIQYNLVVGDEIKLSKEVTSDEDWAYTFSNLPKYSKGVEIVYTVTETEVEGYTTTFEGDAASGYTFTNSYTPEKTSVSGVKVWEDADDQDGKRPTSITVTLYGNGEKVTSTSVTEDDDWSFTFDDLPKYDQGVEIGYTIEENEITGYEGVITGNFKEGYTITNTHIPTTVTISGEKSWVDSNDKDGLRPTSITVNLKADGEVVDTITVTEADEWKYTFADLPEYSGGSKITYSIEEEAVEHYDTTYNGYSIINTHNPKDVTVEGVKTWDDDDNIYGRPEKITVKLTGKKGDETIVTQTKDVTEADEWKYSFTGLPEYKDGILMTYSISEEEVLDYSTTYDGYNIKNTYTPKTVDFSGEKIWDDADDQDGKRETSITINLLADGEVVDTAIVSEETDWKFEFTDKVYYANGKKIEYTIEEVKVEGYETDLESETDEETGNITFSITNTHTPAKVSFKVTKEWADEDDYDEIRPDTLTVYLYKTVDGTRTKVKEQTISGPEWTYEFTDLPKYESGKLITYDISEDEVAGYVSSIEDAVIVNDENITQLIINTHEPELSISGTKTWDDDDDRDGARPGTITVYLYADGELIGEKEVSEDTEWFYEFTDLKVFNNHKEIEYEIKEKPVDNYETTYDGYDITNTHTPETIEFTITKFWIDEDDKDHLRPSSIIVSIYGNGEFVKQVEITGAELTELGDWTYTIELPKYIDGEEATYTIEEKVIDGYTAVYNERDYGYEIVNVHTPETGDTDIIPPPHTDVEVESVEVINNPLENVVIYDDKKKKWMM